MLKTPIAAVVAVATMLSAFPDRARAGTPNQNFVSQAFLDLLNRPADPLSLSDFSAALDTSSLTRTQVAFDIENTDEYRGIEVQSGYQLLLQRPAGPAESSPFVSFLGSGGTVEQVRATLAGSNEYLADNGGTNDGFLSALYGELLQRPISNSELASDETFLASGTRQQFAGVVMASAEYRQDLVTGWYDQFLHRPTDSSAVAFTTELGNGVTDETVIAQIIGSPEYFQNAQSTPEPSMMFAALGGLLLLRRSRRR